MVKGPNGLGCRRLNAGVTGRGDASPECAKGAEEGTDRGLAPLRVEWCMRDTLGRPRASPASSSAAAGARATARRGFQARISSAAWGFGFVRSPWR